MSQNSEPESSSSELLDALWHKRSIASRIGIASGGAFLAVLLTIGVLNPRDVGDTETTSTTSPITTTTQPRTTQESDGAARLACRHYVRVADDYSNGILTYTEMRTKLQEVYNDAQYSDDAGVRIGVRELLAAWTRMAGAEELRPLVNELAIACRPHLS